MITIITIIAKTNRDLLDNHYYYHCQDNRDMLEKNYGILTVEEVSEGFMQLVENCGNGAAVIVFKVFLVSLESSIRDTVKNYLADFFR